MEYFLAIGFVHIAYRQNLQFCYIKNPDDT